MSFCFDMDQWNFNLKGIFSLVDYDFLFTNKAISFGNIFESYRRRRPFGTFKL